MNIIYMAKKEPQFELPLSDVNEKSSKGIPEFGIGKEKLHQHIHKKTSHPQYTLGKVKNR